jgi:hypothetical protein
MLYIHKLFQLTPKAADIEAVALMREIKEKTPYPIQEQRLQDYLGVYFASETDIQYMQNAVQLINDIIAEINEMGASKDPIYEPINLQRTIQQLRDIPKALNSNISFAESIFKWQSILISEMASVLNAIPTIKSDAERAMLNQKLSKVFEKILRAEDFKFNSSDIVNETEKEAITALSDSMAKGFIFRTSLEEEIKKQDFFRIASRIPADKLDKHKKIRESLQRIRIGIDRAYDLNMRMINLAVILYAYIKWINSMKA